MWNYSLRPCFVFDMNIEVTPPNSKLWDLFLSWKNYLKSKFIYEFSSYGFSMITIPRNKSTFFNCCSLTNSKYLFMLLTGFQKIFQGSISVWFLYEVMLVWCHSCVCWHISVFFQSNVKCEIEMKIKENWIKFWLLLGFVNHKVFPLVLWRLGL